MPDVTPKLTSRIDSVHLLILLAAADGIKREDNLANKILITFGRVPFFYFILQMFISHGAGVLLSYLAGKDTAYLFYNFPASATGAPPGAGFSLWVVYVVLIAGLIILYPLCLWYSKVKQGKQGFPYSYL